MTEYLLMLAALVVFTLQTLCFRQFNRYYMRNLASYFIFNTLYFTIVSIICYILKPAGSAYHPYSVILGVIFGVLFVATMFFYMKGMEAGPLSFTALFFSLALIIPVLAGLLLWDEKLGQLQLAGLVLLFITFYLGSSSTSASARGVNVKWFLFTFVAFLGNGLLMSITKGHQVLLPGKQVREFIFLCFFTATVASLLVAAGLLLYRKEDIKHLKSPYFRFIVLATGLTTAVGNIIMFYLAGKVDGVILFPVVNGGVVVLSSIASLFLFREKLPGKGIVGLVIGMAAIVLLSLP